MTTSNLPPQTLPPTNAGRIHRIQLATLRDELLAPLNGIISLSEMLLEEASNLAPERFIADLRTIHEAGQSLFALVQKILQPGSVETTGTDPRAREEQARRDRHEMRNLLNPIINYCEVWLEDTEEQFLQVFADDLQMIHTYGKRCAERIDRFLTQGVAGADPAPTVPLPDWQHQPLAAEPGTLLVADDNATNRDILERRLRRQGHTVTLASNGRQALELARAQPFDLLLLDIMMPQMNGFEVLERLKADEQLRHLPVIMISALDDIEGVVRAIEMGAEDYLTKPYNPVVLKARIGACLEKKRLRDREATYLQQIEQQKRRADELLHVILPGEVVPELKATGAVRPRRYENVAVLFADIVGFTPYCDRHPAEEVVAQLQKLVESWEAIALRHGVEKIKTVGDAFMAASGLLKPTTNPVLHCVQCAREMLAAVKQLTTGWDLRIGIHAGQVVAGVVGSRQYLFDLWGDTVNTAARMESHGVAGSITLSGDAWRQVAHLCRGERLRSVEVKGKGKMDMIRFVEFVKDPK